MSKVPTAIAAAFTRVQLAEMLASTYSGLRNVDINEAYLRLEEAFHGLALIEGVQGGLYRALRRRRPKLDDNTLATLVNKKIAKKQRYTALASNAKNEGPLAALTILIDEGAGLSSGEAYDLLASPEGAIMLEQGFDVIGDHLAKQIVG